MYCRNCGKEVNEKAVACPACGVPPLAERNFCNNCGQETTPNQALCTNCGASLATGESGEKNKIVAGILAILLGGLGIHKFYLGYTKEGIIMLAISIGGGIFTCGLTSAAVSIIALIEGIIYLTKSDLEFEQIYVAGNKEWF